MGRNVARVSYATSLMKKGVLISTTEHLLSAFIGSGIDNAIVELDNLELPILDGSARPFVEIIREPAFASSGGHARICASGVNWRCGKGTSSSRFIRPTVIRFRTRSIFPIP